MLKEKLRSLSLSLSLSVTILMLYISEDVNDFLLLIMFSGI
jgi:hypothetical protein